MDKTLRNAQMVVMRSQGKTFQEIGDAFGMSRQAAEQIIKEQYAHSGERRRRKSIDINRIVYPKIREYFENNPDVGYAGFCRRAFGNYVTKGNGKKIKDLFGGSNARLSLQQIEGICKEIGAPFEVVFKREDCNE